MTARMRASDRRRGDSKTAAFQKRKVKIQCSRPVRRSVRAARAKGRRGLGGASSSAILGQVEHEAMLHERLRSRRKTVGPNRAMAARNGGAASLPLPRHRGHSRRPIQLLPKPLQFTQSLISCFRPLQ